MLVDLQFEALLTGKKEAIAEQLRLGQELRRKVDRVDTVAGSDEDTDTGAETSSSESEDDAQPGKRGLSKKAAGKLQSAAAGILDEGALLQNLLVMCMSTTVPLSSADQATWFEALQAILLVARIIQML